MLEFTILIDNHKKNGQVQVSPLAQLLLKKFNTSTAYSPLFLRKCINAAILVSEKKSKYCCTA